MAKSTATRAANLAGLFVASWLVAQQSCYAGELPVDEAPTQTIHVAASDFGSRYLALGVSKSVVIDLPRDIKDVLVADPKIANAVVRSARRAYIIGSTVGQTNIFFFDADGKQMAGFDIAVKRELNGIRAAIRQVLPNDDIEVEGIGEGVILSGTAASQAEAQQAYDIAVRLLGSGSSETAATGSKVLNTIVVRGRDQVMLKVTVAEVDRDIIKQLGINLSGSLGYGTAVVNFNNTNPYPVNAPTTPSGSIAGTFKGVTATLQAMDQAGVVRTLAEPTLTAISGEAAHFLAGGMFPYPTVSCNAGTCQPSVQFQNFGVSLTFTPVVLSEGRISRTC